MNKIDICDKCKKHKFDVKQGIVCGLTNAKPIFEKSCPDFDPIETAKSDPIIIEEKKLELKPNKQRAKTAILLIWLVLGAEVVMLISSVLQYDLLNTLLNGGNVSYSALYFNDIRVSVISILYLILYIISAVTFIMWFRRAYFNLHQKVKNLSFTEGWAAGSWFVPIVSIYRPYKIMREIYKETKSHLKKTDDSLQIDLNTTLLGVWWTILIISGLYGQVTYRIMLDADTIPLLMTSTLLDVIGNLVGVILAFITIKIIKDYSKFEGLLIELK